MSSTASTASSIFAPKKKPLEINVILIKTTAYAAILISLAIAVQLTFAPPKRANLGAGAAQSASAGHPDHFIVTGSMKALPGHESRLPEAYSTMFGNPNVPPPIIDGPVPSAPHYYSANQYQNTHPQTMYYTGSRLKTVTSR